MKTGPTFTPMTHLNHKRKRESEFFLSSSPSSFPPLLTLHLALSSTTLDSLSSSCCLQLLALSSTPQIHLYASSVKTATTRLLKMRRKCALCNAPARLYCHSDHAFICWHCDSRVHSANFLAARHSRNLLCGVCHSSTPWNASGARLGQIVSICARCVHGCDRSTKVTGANVDESRRRKENEEDVESQAVTCPDERSPPPPPPAAASSSSSHESSNRLRNCDRDDSLKRRRGNNDVDDDAECCSSSSSRRTRTVSGSSDSARALKVQRLEQYEEPVTIKKQKMAQDQPPRRS